MAGKVSDLVYDERKIRAREGCPARQRVTTKSSPVVSDWNAYVDAMGPYWEHRLPAGHPKLVPDRLRGITDNSWRPRRLVLKDVPDVVLRIVAPDGAGKRTSFDAADESVCQRLDVSFDETRQELTISGRRGWAGAEPGELTVRLPHYAFVRADRVAALDVENCEFDVHVPENGQFRGSGRGSVSAQSGAKVTVASRQALDISAYGDQAPEITAVTGEGGFVTLRGDEVALSRVKVWRGTDFLDKKKPGFDLAAQATRLGVSDTSWFARAVGRVDIDRPRTGRVSFRRCAPGQDPQTTHAGPAPRPQRKPQQGVPRRHGLGAKLADRAKALTSH